MELETDHHESKVVELLSGVDALYASSKTVVPNDLFASLMEVKSIPEESIDLRYLPIAGQQFEISSYAWGRYPVFIEHEFGRVGFTKSEKMPGIRLQIRSKFLHAVGAEKALEWFTTILKDLRIYPSWTLSRLDLFADIQGWDLRHSDQDQFATRASDLTSRKVSNNFSGFEFGRRKSGTINARIYDKTREMLKQPNGWTFDQWGERFDHSLPVWRIEFEFHTELLREAGIPTAQIGLENKGALWAYATESWLTHHLPGVDSNKARWVLSPEWLAIQNVKLRGKCIPIQRIRDKEDALDIQRLIPGLFGYVTSVGAKMGAHDLRTALDVAFQVLSHDEREGRRSAIDTLEYKKNRPRR